MYEVERERLVNALKRQRRIITDKVEKAFLEIPRELFIPDSLKKHSYFDSPLEIGHGQTISAPHMVAIMCEALDIQEGEKILEIGAGSGYHAAIVSKLVGDNGHIYSIERISFLVKQAKRNIQSARIENVTVVKGDGSEGYVDCAPYNSIYVTCAAPELPQPLIDQLKDPGKLLIPVGKMICDLILVEKKEKNIIKHNLGGCAFVPLIGKHGY